jgi:hypothetical protein
MGVCRHETHELETALALLGSAVRSLDESKFTP